MNGVILAGGKSSRMGQNKSKMIYPGISHLEQRLWLAQVLASAGLEVYLSIRIDSEKIDFPKERILFDADRDSQGPAGGILRAFQHHHGPWFVIACDYPFADEASIRDLIEHPDCKSGRSVTYADEAGKIQPLFTYWNINALQTLEKGFKAGEKSPSKALLDTETTVITPHDPRVLANMNSPTDLERYPALIETKQKP